MDETAFKRRRRRLFIESPRGGMGAGAILWGGEDDHRGCHMLPGAGCAPTEEQMKSNKVSADERDMSAQTGPGVVIVSIGQIMHKCVLVPERLHVKLLTVAMPEKHHHYWWLALGITHLVRLHDRTLRKLARCERALLRGRPPAPGCVSLYTRRGDKSTEAPVFTDRQYAEVVERLVEGGPSLTRQVFLSTEDAGSVKFFIEACGTGGTGSGSDTWARGGAACRSSSSRREWRSRQMLKSGGGNGTAAAFASFAPCVSFIFSLVVALPINQIKAECAGAALINTQCAIGTELQHMYSVFRHPQSLRHCANPVCIHLLSSTAVKFVPMEKNCSVSIGDSGTVRQGSLDGMR